jgi:hypothetical protein
MAKRFLILLIFYHQIYTKNIIKICVNTTGVGALSIKILVTALRCPKAANFDVFERPKSYSKSTDF